jgi:hypothetical protein
MDIFAIGIIDFSLTAYGSFVLITKKGWIRVGQRCLQGVGRRDHLTSISMFLTGSSSWVMNSEFRR